MRQRKIISLILLLAISIALFGCSKDPSVRDITAVTSYTSIPGITESEKLAIEQLKKSYDSFTYGVLESTEVFYGTDGNMHGFAVEICTLLEQLFGIPFIPVEYTWSDLLNDLESNQLNFTGELTATEVRIGSKSELFEIEGELVRGEGYLMSEPIAQRMLRVYTTDDKTIIHEEDIDGFKIGFMQGTVTEYIIRQRYNLNFTSVEITVPNDAPKGTIEYDVAVEMLHEGSIDAFIEEATADKVINRYIDIKSHMLFNMIHSPVSLTTADADLEVIISVMNKYIATGGAEYLNDLYIKGEADYSKYKLQNSFSDEERAYISSLKEQDQPVYVGYEYDNYPICFYNETEKMFQGIAVDVIYEIAQLTDIRFETKSSSETTFRQAYDMLLNGEVDILTQITMTKERSDVLRWSRVPYTTEHYCILSRNEVPYLSPHQVHRMTVGVVNDDGKIKVYNGFFPEDENLVEYESQYECLDALENTEIDLMMGSEFNLLTEINYRERSGLKINLKLTEVMDNNFGYRQDSEILASIIDKTQEYVDTERIEISWTGKQFDYSQKLSSERATFMLIILAILVVVITIMIFILLHMMKLSKQLQEVARYDALTGIFNRRYFMELAQMQLSRLERTKTESYITIFDLDHFKLVNDTYGHVAGDKVLRDIAQRVKKSIREYDILARYGGEEFIIMISDNDKLTKENAMIAIERIRSEIERRPIRYNDDNICVTASFGVACAQPRSSLLKVIQQADDALYVAKETGRNKVVFSGEDESSEDDVGSED